MRWAGMFLAWEMTFIQNYNRKTYRTANLGGLGLDGMIILKRTLKKFYIKCDLNSSILAQVPVVGSCDTIKKFYIP